MTMTTAESLARYYGIIHNVVNRQLDGLTNEESLIQPPFRGNCLNWVLGHIVFSRTPVLTLLQADVPWSEEEAARYQRNSEPVTSAEGTVPFDRLRDYFEASHTRIMAGLQHISPERMALADDDGSTVGEEIAFLQWHETYHVGQLDHLRQLAGKNDKVI